VRGRLEDPDGIATADEKIAVGDGDFATAEFLAHSREDVPFLLGLIDALTAERDRLREELAWVKPDYATAMEVLNLTRQQLAEARDSEELAWGVIANAGGGDWKRETEEWQGATARWRDRYFARLTPPEAKCSTCGGDVNVHDMACDGLTPPEAT
jgi:hypothetical protein